MNSVFGVRLFFLIFGCHKFYCSKRQMRKFDKKKLPLNQTKLKTQVDKMLLMRVQQNSTE